MPIGSSAYIFSAVKKSYIRLFILPLELWLASLQHLEISVWKVNTHRWLAILHAACMASTAIPLTSIVSSSLSKVRYRILLSGNLQILNFCDRNDLFNVLMFSVRAHTKFPENHPGLELNLVSKISRRKLCPRATASQQPRENLTVA